MLITAKDIIDCKVIADDGTCGKVCDILFDDSTWSVRYLVLRTVSAEGHVDLLLPVETTYRIDSAARMIRYRGPAGNIKSLKPLDLDPPVSRQQQLTRKAIKLFTPFYDFGQAWGAFSMSAISEWYLSNLCKAVDQKINYEESKYDPHLRSGREIIGYRVHAPNGAAGHVADIVLDDLNHMINSMIIGAHRFWTHSSIILPVQHVGEICWSTMQVAVDIDKRALRLLTHHAPI
jgi:hypothetical protein